MNNLWALASLFASPGRPLPAPGGWALSAEALVFTVQQVADRKISTLVELGPGASSVVLSRAADLAGTKLRATGLEHDARFVAKVSALLDYHGIHGYELLHAPLTSQSVGGRQVLWYDPSAVEKLPNAIDLLIVDGPPKDLGRQIRNPAWTKLRNRLVQGAMIIVDDTMRHDERSMVEQWLASGGLRLVHRGDSFVALVTT